MGETATYKVSTTLGRPNFDSVPVAKIIDYPLEKRDYRPFAQCILCVGGDRLYLRMWAFEVSPSKTSALSCVIYPYAGDPELALDFRFEHSGGDDVAVSLFPMRDGKDFDPSTETARRMSEACHMSAHNGEDLQGVYWGMTLSVSIDVLEEIGGKTVLSPGNSFPGNFYKTCGDERFAHMGSLFPAAFPDDPYGRDSMGTFQVISY